MEAKNQTSNTVPLKTKIAWGLGGWADDYTFVVINILFLYLYVDYFRMDPVLAGVALFIPRVFDAITDPIIGNWSDNFRSRWGRRRPLIVAGAIGCAILLPLYWLPPMLETIKNPWYSNIPFIYVSILGCFYAAVYTLFVVPYTALGYELSEDYDERTKVLSWRMYFGLIGQTATPLVYTLSVNKDLFPNIRVGAVSKEEITNFQKAVMNCAGELDAEKDWVFQLHFGAMRNVRHSIFSKLGPDTGVDTGNCFQDHYPGIVDLLNVFDNRLKVVLYCFDPTQISTVASVARAFCSKVKIGAPWWQCDNPIGMKRQLEYFGSVDLLNNCSGMVSDSRKLLSYGSRHEMFRRVLADVLGSMAELGQAPEEILTELAVRLCYEQPRSYFAI